MLESILPGPGLKGGAPIGEILKKVEKDFNYDNPGESVPALMEAYKMIKALPDGYWKRVKLNEIKEVIQILYGAFC